MTKDLEMEAVSAMAEAAYWHDNPYGNGNGIPLHRYRIEAALSADPLRRLLGPEAVRALMEGKACVVSATTLKNLCDLAESGISLLPESLRLDKPSKE